MKRLKNYNFFNCKQNNCFDFKQYKMIDLNNNFIFAFKQFCEHKKFAPFDFLYLPSEKDFFSSLSTNLFKTAKIVVQTNYKTLKK